ncbi:Rrf2 family transcriptional regulator [uncultured Megamonas sp.]|uniref:RrF2 family transcriptional regulator n=2 Tax=uncultured Megamonas sp. TaxID=286140 RepID=UPI0026702045|nr:Rrf2 family transcriptional regulator [uncultured Megamonas sp.]
MQLNITTDYAIRILLALADRDGEVVSSKDISMIMKIPQKYVLKITRSLVAAELIERRSGVYGGFLLAKKPEEISLLEIVKVMEPTMRVNRCLEKDNYCSREATENCPIRKFHINFQNILEDRFSAVTVKTLLDNK